MQAHHAVGCVVDHQLHQRAFGAAAQRVFERFKFRFVHPHLAILFTRLRFAQAHGANVGVGEHGGGNIAVIHLLGRLARCRAKQMVHQLHGLAQRHGGELHAVGHIAQGIYAGHVGLIVCIDDHGAHLVGARTHGIKRQVFGVGHAACGRQHHIGHQLLAIV